MDYAVTAKEILKKAGGEARYPGCMLRCFRENGITIRMETAASGTLGPGDDALKI